MIKCSLFLACSVQRYRQIEARLVIGLISFHCGSQSGDLAVINVRFCYAEGCQSAGDVMIIGQCRRNDREQFARCVNVIERQVAFCQPSQSAPVLRFQLQCLGKYLDGLVGSISLQCGLCCISCD